MLFTIHQKSKKPAFFATEWWPKFQPSTSTSTSYRLVYKTNICFGTFIK